ncbi:MAG: (2Fe-2S) ferredoxin domain-containing protein [Candidatus Aenigmarchaeota archaeon]|nr:(2Fe-2S) ferredoxin domain-containing protein [Candidatus Aenigmarchaeota archaeon]
MKQVDRLPEKHIFICVNNREQGSCCLKVNGIDTFQKIKSYILSHGLAGRVWVTKTGCQGFCNPVGTTISVYPEKKIFTEVKPEEVDKILEEVLSK